MANVKIPLLALEKIWSTAAEATRVLLFVAECLRSLTSPPV
jgi:hypothetical protein